MDKYDFKFNKSKYFTEKEYGQRLGVAFALMVGLLIIALIK